MQHKAQMVLLKEVRKLPTLPTYSQAIAIVRKVEAADECWYGWLYERKVVELIANVWKQVKDEADTRQ